MAREGLGRYISVLLRGGKLKWFLVSVAIFNVFLQSYFYYIRSNTVTGDAKSAEAPSATFNWRAMLERHPELIRVEKKLQGAREYIQAHGTKDMMTSAIPLLVFGYQRGGSSFAGKIISKHPASFYWFEPLKGPIRDLYGEPKLGVETLPIQYSIWRNGSIRHIPQYESDALTAEIAHVMRCELSQLSMKTLGRHGYIHASESLKNYNQCFNYQASGIKLAITCDELETEFCPNLSAEYTTKEAHLCRQKLNEVLHNNVTGTGYDLDRLNRLRMCTEKLWTIMKQCIPEVQFRCDRSVIRVAKIIRTSMETVVDLLIKYPSILVVHLLRDPRGILRSRLSLKYMRSEKLSEEARHLCTSMLYDIRIRRRLEKMFTKNFLTLRYENMAENPGQAAREIYELMAEDMPQNMEESLTQMVQADADIGGAFGLTRANGSATANAWKGMSVYELRLIDLECKELYAEAGYTESFVLDKSKGFIRRDSPLE
ncbi:uncharacterized protein LOC135493404 [Lineus longissimus]|uniref:uncharacterized protein LOC135493404 n=1 Tax=Lineus longissimus TaxID=88925 RepID=UPI002B4E0060